MVIIYSKSLLLYFYHFLECKKGSQYVLFFGFHTPMKTFFDDLIGSENFGFQSK